ncbi:MAG: Uma2 family endonuclease [Candidatus Xenobia bacterium]
MALRKTKGEAEAECLFGWDPYAYMDDQDSVNQDEALKQSFARLLAEQGIAAHLGNMTPVRFMEDERAKELGPDLYIVTGCEPRRRKFWKAWEEGGRYPDLIVEFLSRSTARHDRGGKMNLYESVFKTPEYYLYDPEKLTLEGYRLSGERYVRLLPDANGHVPCNLVGGSLGIHDGLIRLFRADGSLVPTDKEAADAAETERKAERERADAAEARAEALEQELKRLRDEHKR